MNYWSIPKLRKWNTKSTMPLTGLEFIVSNIIFLTPISAYLFHTDSIEWGRGLKVPKLQYLSVVISDAFIEFLSIQHQEVFIGGQDATLGGDRPGGVHIVSSDHSNCDSCTLALFNASWNLHIKTKVYNHHWRFVQILVGET